MIFTTNMLKEKYRDYANPLDKIKREADAGALIRIHRGIYETDPTVSPYLLAPVMLSPSYLSFDWALSHYGLIPERVYSITSASFEVRKNKVFQNAFGYYEFSDIPAEAFPEGVGLLEEGDYVVKIASKEKAICDSLYKWRVVQNIAELKELLFEDHRIDEEEFEACDFALMMRLAQIYHRANLKVLIQWIRKEYLHE